METWLPILRDLGFFGLCIYLLTVGRQSLQEIRDALYDVALTNLQILTIICHDNPTLRKQFEQKTQEIIEKKQESNEQANRHRNRR